MYALTAAIYRCDDSIWGFMRLTGGRNIFLNTEGMKGNMMVNNTILTARVLTAWQQPSDERFARGFLILVDRESDIARALETGESWLLPHSEADRWYAPVKSPSVVFAFVWRSSGIPSSFLPVYPEAEISNSRTAVVEPRWQSAVPPSSSLESMQATWCCY